MLRPAFLPTPLKRQGFLPWAAPCLGLLALGDVWRFYNFQVSRSSSFAFIHLAYSDIFVLYFKHHLASHQIPYLQTHIEYPVVTGFIMWLTAFVPGVDGYFWANAVLLMVCAAGSLALLSRLVPSRRLWRFALAPILVSYGALNWDMVSVLELAGAIYLVRRDRFGWAGTMLALGLWTKLYPGFVFPVVFAYSLRLERANCGRLRSWRSRPMRLVSGFLLVTAVLNLPIAIFNFQGWSYPIIFQGGRGLNPDAIWSHVPNMSLPLAGFWSLTILSFGLIWLTMRTRRVDRWEVGALLAILLFLLTTKDYSPQYDVWLLPLLVLLACPFWLWLAYCVADLAYYAGIFWWLYHAGGGNVLVAPAQGNIALGATVWGREIALVLLFLWGVSVLAREVAPLMLPQVERVELLQRVPERIPADVDLTGIRLVQAHDQEEHRCQQPRHHGRHGGLDAQVIHPEEI
jgi:hypothetical protein